MVEYLPRKLETEVEKWVQRDKSVVILILFFVVDRPAGLEVLKGIFVECPHLQFGLMTHANISDNFLEIFKAFPYKTELKYVSKSVQQRNIR